MATTVIMPRQGQSVETCILGQWFKAPGEEVKAGDLLFSYETDKASFEEEAAVDGILLARYYEEGDEVPVLSEIALIGEKGEVLPERSLSGAGTPEASAEEEPPRVIEFPVDPDVRLSGRISASPLARNMAEKLGIDLYALTGSGPHGRIIARDIEAAGSLKLQTAAATSASPKVSPLPEAPAIKPAPAGTIGEPLPQQSFPEEESLRKPAADGRDFEIRPLTHMRKRIARAMQASLQNSAQLTHHLSADARNLLAARKKLKARFEMGEMAANVTINDLVAWAVIHALRKFPAVNAHLLGDEIKYFHKVHLGLAVDTDRGLMVAAVRDADDLSLTGLSSRLQQLAAECRKGSINPDLLSPEAASFTISNLGNYGVEIFTPVINLPQTAILGVCTILPRPKDLGDGLFAFVPHIGLSLTYDHRALDGGEATRFLAEVSQQIENLKFN